MNWRSPEVQTSNSTSDVVPVSMNLGSNSRSCRLEARPGTHVTAEAMPVSASHGRRGRPVVSLG